MYVGASVWLREISPEKYAISQKCPCWQRTKKEVNKKFMSTPVHQREVVLYRRRRNSMYLKIWFASSEFPESAVSTRIYTRTNTRIKMFSTRKRTTAILKSNQVLEKKKIGNILGISKSIRNSIENRLTIITGFGNRNLTV